MWGLRVEDAVALVLGCSMYQRDPYGGRGKGGRQGTIFPSKALY